MNNIILNVFYYFTSILAVCLFIGSIQFKEKKDILLVQSGASLCYLFSYLILGAFSGWVTEILLMSKNITFYLFEKNNKNIPLLYLIIFTIFLILIGIITYNGLISLAPIFINLVYLYTSYFKNPILMRLSVFACAFIWIYYNYKVGANIVIFGNVFEIISGSIALWRFKNEAK